MHLGESKVLSSTLLDHHINPYNAVAFSAGDNVVIMTSSLLWRSVSQWLILINLDHAHLSQVDPRA